MHETKMELIPMVHLVGRGEINSDGFPKRCDSSKIRAYMTRKSFCVC